MAIAACDPGKTGANDLVPSSATSSAAETPSNSDTGPKLCEAAESLKKRLAPIDVQASRTAVEETTVLPESNEGERAPQGVVVTFRKGGFGVDGQTAATPAAVMALVEQRSQRSILFAIDKNDEDLARVSSMADAVGDSAPIYVLASPPGTKVTAPPASLAKELHGQGPSERATILAKALGAAIAGCRAATKLFGTLATQEPDSRAATLKEELPRAVHECDCKVSKDLDELVAFVLESDRLTVAKPLVVSGEGKAVSLKGLNGQALYTALPARGAVRLEK